MLSGIQKIALGMAFLPLVSVHALEAVVQSDVGSGSAVAGSIGAVNSRADALQGNMNAANLVIQQLQNRVSELEKLVSTTMLVITKITTGTDGVPGFNGLNGSSGNGSNGVRGLDGVSVKSGKGNWCGAVTWSGQTGYSNGEYYREAIKFGPYVNYSHYPIYSHMPCNGEPMVVNHEKHCPAGYTFVTVQSVTDTDTVSTPRTETQQCETANCVSSTSSQMFLGTCTML